MNKDQIAAKIRKLQQKLDAINRRIAADTATKKSLQKEIDDLQAAQIVEMIRSASGSPNDIAEDFAAFLQAKAAAEETAAGITPVNQSETTETEVKPL